MRGSIIWSDDKRIKKNILISIPILFLIGTPIHFLYNITGKLNAIALFAPVNESIWEHTKLATIPVILWWVISYFILKKKSEINFGKWIFCASISMLTIPIVITCFYYSYTGALGISSLIIDIFSLLFALIVGQSLALHLYNHIRIRNKWSYIGILIIAIIIAFTFTVTFNTPELPMFKDGPTGTYGI